MVMIHGQGSIEAGVVAKAEEAVRRIRTVGQNALLGCFLYCRKDNLLLLVADKAAVAAVRVESEHSNLGLIYAEVPAQ